MRPDSLHLSVGVAHGRFVAPRLTGTRQPSPATVLRGRAAEDALSLVPLLFSLCGTAQQVAALEACEQALGMTPAAPQRAARRLLVGAETLGELTLGVLRDWPLLLDQPPRLDDARRVRGALSGVRAALGPGPWHVPGGAPLRIDRTALATALADARAVVRRAVFGDAPPVPPGDWTEAAPGPARDMLRHLAMQGMEDFGASAVPLLAAATPAPDGVAETGPLARRAADPAVAWVLERHGPGIAARMTARLADIAATLRDLEETAAEVCDDAPPPAPPGGSGQGTGRVEAARGRLVHRVALRDGRIADWTIVAPTDWNFHPRGPLVQGLEEAPAGANPEHRARLLVAALDPCVACEVEVRNDA